MNAASARVRPNGRASTAPGLLADDPVSCMTVREAPERSIAVAAGSGLLAGGVALVAGSGQAGPGFPSTAALAGGLALGGNGGRGTRDDGTEAEAGIVSGTGIALESGGKGGLSPPPDRR